MRDRSRRNRWHRCAQRLSASKTERTRVERNASTHAIIVLNAFRHQRNRNTASDAIAGLYRRSAQRLSASKESEHVPTLIIAHFDCMCSTPFGIKGIGTLLQLNRAISDIDVLNAFRHQRNGTALGSLAIAWISRRAQRLSASKEWNHGCRSGWPSRSCQVLNAFRHQRNGTRPISRSAIAGIGQCSTPFGIKGIGTRAGDRWHRQLIVRAQRLSASKESEHRSRCHWRLASFRVLNAFRHQRNGTHHRFDARCRRPIACSTPFGIKGMEHIVDRMLCECSVVCSTPFGIKGIESRLNLPATSANVGGAQRLSASKIESYAMIVMEDLRGKRSAQRLSASKIESSY